MIGLLGHLADPIRAGLGGKQVDSTTGLTVKKHTWKHRKRTPTDPMFNLEGLQAGQRCPVPLSLWLFFLFSFHAVFHDANCCKWTQAEVRLSSHLRWRLRQGVSKRDTREGRPCGFVEVTIHQILVQVSSLGGACREGSAHHGVELFLQMFPSNLPTFPEPAALRVQLQDSHRGRVL